MGHKDIINKKTSVVLGCWGLGQHSDKPFSPQLHIILTKGPFKGLFFPKIKSLYKEKDCFQWRLPPLSRLTSDGIDLMPFILYDKVIIDNLSFDCLLGKIESLEGWKPSKTNVQILERLVEENYIAIEDYKSLLNTSGIRKLLDEMNRVDLSDDNILDPASDALRLWIRFYKDLLGRKDTELLEFYMWLEDISKGHITNLIEFRYIYECIADINAMLITSKILKSPIYDWEDYLKFYKYKFLRVGSEHSSKPEGQVLRELFQTFVPNFKIESYSQLMEIKTDPRLNSVRDIVHAIRNETVDKEFIKQTYEDVLRVKGKVETYSRYVGLLSMPLSFLPFGTIVQEAINLIGNHIIKKLFEKNIKWQCFFVERSLLYNKKHIEDKLKARTNL